MNAPALVRTPALTAEWKKIPAGMRSLWRQCLPGGDGGDVARSMTINFLGVALAENADVLNEALQRLQRRSPCRAFLVLIDDAAKPGAAELAATTRGTGSVRDIVLEEILVRVPRSAFAALPGLIRPLLMNDLPNHLFWAAPWPADAGHFDALADLCHHAGLEIHRGAGAERGRHTPRAPVARRELQHHRHRPGMLCEDLLDTLEQRDRTLVVEHLSEPDDDLS